MSRDDRHGDDYLFAAVSATADGDNTVVAAVVGRRIRVLSYVLARSDATAGEQTVLLKSAASTTLGTLKLGLSTAAGAVAANVTVVYSGEHPAVQTAVGEGFVINNPAGVDVVGHVTYVLTGA